MSLEKKAIARIVVYDPATRRNFWQGTVYRNGIQTPNNVVRLIKEVLGGLKVKKEPKEDPPWLKKEWEKLESSSSIENDNGVEK